MSNLIELTTAAQRLLSLVEDSGGELTPEIEAALNLNAHDLAIKVDGYGYLLDRIPAVAQYWKDQSDQAARVAKGLEALEARIKSHLKAGMIMGNITVLQGETVKFSISDSKPALIIDTPPPPEYMMTVTKLVPDNERIRADLGVGVEINGASLRRGVTLRQTKRRKI